MGSILSGTHLVVGLLIAIGLGLAVMLAGGVAGRRPTATVTLEGADPVAHPLIELTPQSPVGERLRALWHMHQQGVLSDEEYEQLRTELLADGGDHA